MKDKYPPEQSLMPCVVADGCPYRDYRCERENECWEWPSGLAEEEKDE